MLCVLLPLLANRLPQKESLHFWGLQQQLDLQLGQTSISSCGLSWAAVKGLWETNLALQEKADVIFWPIAWNGLYAAKYEVAEKTL